MKKMMGFTLVELLIVITVIAIMLTSAVPAISDLLTGAQRRTAVYDLVSLLAVARQEAIATGKIMTLCPLNDNNECGKDWNGEIHLFTDPYNQRKLTAGNQIVRTLPPLKTGTLKIASLNKSYFQYRPNGMILSDLGNLTWCPPSGDASQAAHIIVSRGGRIRLAVDKNGDGIPEKSNGNPVEC